MNSYSNVVPPGFRFHPTDEELVDYYLRKRVASKRIDLDVIKDIDLYRIEPWDLQELCQAGTDQADQSDYYFFSHKDKKYPTGTRTNRATREGFWKATGRDKPIYVKRSLVGMRKTLVFYKGRAPNGVKLDWIMHEYRLENDENAIPQEEGWVVCRVFKKRMVMRKLDHHNDQHESPYWCDEQASSFLPDMDSPMQINLVGYDPSSSYSSSCTKQEQQSSHPDLYNNPSFLDHHLPQHDQIGSQIMPDMNNASVYGFEDQGAAHPQQNYYQPHFGDQQNMIYGNNNSSCSFIDDDDGQRVQDEDGGMNNTDGWRVLDKYVASQLSLDHVTGENHNYLNH